MERLLRMLVVASIGLSPGVIAILLIVRERRARPLHHQVPFQELRRRPAGEAIRIKLGELDDNTSQYLTMFMVLPFVAAMQAWFIPTSGWLSLIPAVFLTIAVTTFFSTKLYRTWRKREDYQLGFEGERYVGEELSQLIAKGFEVYHDVPFEKEKNGKVVKFNIDHVLVGPAGVFSVETKTYRKPVDDAGGKQCRVKFDGSRLHWPWCPETQDLEQAMNNAKTLSEWLSGAIGDPVYVTPILALPGWLVDRSVQPSTVQVLNPKEIFEFCSGKERRLSDNLLKRICYQLDQKCKISLE